MHSDSPLARSLLAAARHADASAELRCRMLLERAHASLAWQLALRQALARAGLTESGFAVLAVLRAQRPPSMSRADLVAATELSPARAADALTRLELSGLVERERHGAPTLLRLTAQGALQINAALHCYVRSAKTVTRELDAADLEAAIATSGKIRRGAARLNAAGNAGA